MTVGTARLKFEYNNVKYEDEFNVVNRPEIKTILLSNATVQNITKCSIPIECCIETGNNPPVSWSRPIRSYKDKIDFQIMLGELEEKGIIEESTSAWLNPVVITRKKSGAIRFALILGD